MSRQGPRPHTWKVQGELNHEQHTAWHRQRAQAIFRGEEWTLTFDEFQQIWQGKWDRRGRARDDLCMTRIDPRQGWTSSNVELVTRLDHLRLHTVRQRTGFYKTLKMEDTNGN